MNILHLGVSPELTETITDLDIKRRMDAVTPI
jgi:hypothetical protein